MCCTWSNNTNHKAKYLVVEKISAKVVFNIKQIFCGGKKFMIKKLSVFLFVVIILTLTGCSNKEDISSDISSIESSTAVDFTTDNESSFETSAELTPSSEKQETVVSTTESKEIKPEVKEEKPIANSSVSTAEQKTSDIQSGVSSTPQIQNATAADSKEIALLIAKAINEYRNKNNVDNAIVLPGLTEYAEYRSRQLISNFSHDTFDEKRQPNLNTEDILNHLSMVWQVTLIILQVRVKQL